MKASVAAAPVHVPVHVAVVVVVVVVVVVLYCSTYRYKQVAVVVILSASCGGSVDIVGTQLQPVILHDDIRGPGSGMRLISNIYPPGD